MHCTGCGSKLLENCVFCTSCGKQVNAASAGAGAAPAGAGFANANTSSSGFAQSAPSQPQAQTYPDQKSKMVAGLLGIFLGYLGVHNFYLGFTGKAVWQLLLSTLFGIITFGITIMVASVWGLIEGIMILSSHNGKDAKGIPLKE